MKSLSRTLFATLVLMLAMVLLTMEAKADPVSFNTTGQFNGSGGFANPQSITFGSGPDTLTLTFTGVNTTVDTSPMGFTFASFGQIQTSTTGAGALITPGTTIQIRITQTAPSNGSGDLEGTIDGYISQNSSSGLLTFTVSHVEINGVQYDVMNNSLPLVPPSTNNGIATIQGQVTTAPVPEPTSLLLLASGLGGLGFKLHGRLKRLTSQ